MDWYPERSRGLGGGSWTVGVRRGRREAVGDGPPERLGRLAGGGGGYGGGSRRTVGRHRRGGGGGIVARAGEPLGRERRLPVRHLVLVGEIETLGLRRRHSIVVVAAGSRNRWKWSHGQITSGVGGWC